MFLAIILLARRMERLQLLAQLPHIVRAPSLRVPGIEIDVLGPRVHHEVYGGAAAEEPAGGDDGFAVVEVWGGLRFVELGNGGG